MTHETKSDLLQTTAHLMSDTSERSAEPDATLLALAREKLASHINATSAPAFAVPYSVRVITELMKALSTSAQGCYVLIDSKAWCTFIADSQTIQCLDPETRYAKILAGHLGVLFGVSVYTDAYQHPEEKILQENTLTVMSGDGLKGYSVRLA